MTSSAVTSLLLTVKTRSSNHTLKLPRTSQKKQMKYHQKEEWAELRTPFIFFRDNYFGSGFKRQSAPAWTLNCPQLLGLCNRRHINQCSLWIKATMSFIFNKYSKNTNMVNKHGGNHVKSSQFPHSISYEPTSRKQALQEIL